MENVFASTKNRTISRGILNMDKQLKKLTKIIEKVSYQYFTAHGDHGNTIGPKDDQQSNLLGEAIDGLIAAQSNLNKYVNDKKSTRKAND